MGRALLVLLVVGCFTGCGGEAHGSKASDAGGTGGNTTATTGGNASAGGKQSQAGAGPAPPPRQGAFWVNVKAVSPAPAGKMCPSGASLTFDVPAATPSNPPQSLDGDTYLQKVIDGENQAAVSCSVSGESSFTLEGQIQLGNKSLSISSGALGADKKGMARIILRDSGFPGFSGALSSPSANCVIDAAAAAGSNLQVKAGSIWGHFSCASVEQPPSDFCLAEGYFVFENCDQ